jgi:hypothetical protein
VRTFKWHLETGMQGCDLEGEVEVEDGVSDADIEREVREDMWNRLSLTWEEAANETDPKSRIAESNHENGESSGA